MPSRRFSGNNHWYHETLSTGNHPAPPFATEAAKSTDPFLLGADANADRPLQQVIRYRSAVQQINIALYQRLFPATVITSNLHTLTLYDRLSSALTVAQVTGIQRLCNHYAARLNPLPGPDSSRESNQRLTQITEYARLMAGQPARLNAAALQRLDEVGLTLPDIISFHQLIGFVCYQARIVAGIQALTGQALRWLPGQSVNPDAPFMALDAQASWQAHLDYPQTRYLSDRQRDIVTKCKPSDFPAGILCLLVQDEQLLSAIAQLHSETGSINPLVQAVCACINGSAWCLQQYADSQRRSLLQAGVDTLPAGSFTPAEQAIIHAAVWLTRAPDRFSAGHLHALRQQMTTAQIWLLIEQIAFTNWKNRLFQTLGSLSPQ
ncbi:hypothetical protein BL250_06560 [Erwinia sp. OLTSP20]|uniref:CMD domain-containing protein n=1 Tax=unclassified Erwinia TaxID=2622719 RepID=UPI000C174A9B|nr:MULTISPECIES: oxidoreductase [unclassified Erwinia]PIJ51785.1 hypothetical protein BV501_02270 [Erwinia sp. OAMSP11]PIJ74374.1 hypothetical protein BK416_04205 [Erwinia sp. OLSSP12]PIJ83793.1 hypothetical protein BLD47_03920 [Erwinia sp. OLCASP19]PIJ86836.1 hypothetical protein BLD46_02415 [Erwinia sp. OLMTSP26]PIJ88243.1 hypothetical protein BLD49_03095 [Erwinia sp. OLMDSP33]